MFTHRLLPAVALAGALAAAGCGVHDPVNDVPKDKPATASTNPAPVDAAGADQHTDAGEEYPEDTRSPESLATGAPADDTASDVAAAYGMAQLNWSWKTYDDQYRRMTRMAGGQLAEDLKGARPEQAQIDGMKADEQTNTAKLVAVDARQAGADKKRVVVVYRERPGGAGVVDIRERHTVYRATVTKLAEGWRVTSWSLLP